MVSKATKRVLIIAYLAMYVLVYLAFKAAGVMLVIFVSLLFAVAKSKYDRALIAMIAGTVTFFIIFFEFVVTPEAHADPDVMPDAYAYQVFVNGLIGNPTDNYTNLRSLLLVTGMMIIIQICVQGGLFQIFSFSLIKLTKGNAYALLVAFCFIAMFITAVFNDILTVILLVPLTIEVCWILDINPKIYVLLEAIMVKVGATMFSISSVSDIMISGSFSVSFSEFFLNIGVYSLITFGVTIFFLLGTYSGKLQSATKGIDVLLEYKIGSFIPDRKLLAKCIVVLGCVLTLFALNISFLPADVVTISGAAVLLFWSNVDMKELMNKVDFKLIMYLFGIFVVTGGMQATGLINDIVGLVTLINIKNPLAIVIFALLISAGLSAFIDNIPITRVLIPIIASLIPEGTTTSAIRFAVIAMMVFGVNVGDNLTPFGDTLITYNVAEQNNLHMKPKDFFEIAFKTTLFQYATLIVIFSLQIDPALGLIFLLSYVIGAIIIIRVFKAKMPFSFKKLILAFFKALKRRKKPIQVD
nr:SLC13 family permease [Candidatus Sigynarchaeota archaeon]